MVKALPSTASVTHVVQQMNSGWRMMMKKQKNDIDEVVSACHAVTMLSCRDADVCYDKNRVQPVVSQEFAACWDDGRIPCFGCGVGCLWTAEGRA